MHIHKKFSFCTHIESELFTHISFKTGATYEFIYIPT